MNNTEYQKFTTKISKYPKDYAWSYIFQTLKIKIENLEDFLSIFDNSNKKDIQILLDKTGYLYFYLTRLIDSVGFTIDEVMQNNYENLNDKDSKPTDEDYMNEILLDLPGGTKFVYIPEDEDEISTNKDDK